MSDSSTPNNVISLVQPPLVDATSLVALLRGLADDAERGEIIGLAVVTELTGGRIGTAFEPNDVHRLLGGLERLKARLLDI